jgi:plastocyanin
MRKARALLLAWGVIAATVSATPAIAAGDASPKTYTVVIEQMRFTPSALTVHRGDRVTWINKDLFPHTASANSKAFDSKSIASNASWTYVADRPGTYPYLCIFHPGMAGTLNVQ